MECIRKWHTGLNNWIDQGRYHERDNGGDSGIDDGTNRS